MNFNNYYASKCIDKTITNSAGTKLGKVNDLIISPEGKVEYVVVAHSGFFGSNMGADYAVVPYRLFGYDNDNENLILNVDEDALEDAPTFDKDDLPEAADRAAFTPITSFYTRYQDWNETDYQRRRAA